LMYLGNLIANGAGISKMSFIGLIFTVILDISYLNNRPTSH
jgi:hypothetical protein